MRLLKVEVANFLSVGSSIVDLAQQGLVLIEGDNRDVEFSKSNGAGKSSIFTDAPLWALFGVTTRGLKGADVVRRKQDSCAVSVHVEVAGERYCVTRSTHRRSRKTTLALRCGKDDLSQTKLADTQAKVEALVGADADTFLHTAILGPGMMTRFSKLTDGGRKELLETIIGTWVLDEARKLASKESREWHDKVQSLQRSAHDAKTAIVGWNDHSKEVGGDPKELKKQRRQVKDREKKIATLFVSKGPLADTADDLRAKRTKAIESKAVSEHNARRLYKQIKDLAAVCPACGREVTKKDRKRLTKQWEEQGEAAQEIAANANKDLRALEKKLDGVDGKLDKINDRCAKLERKNRESQVVITKLAEQAKTQAEIAERVKTLSEKVVKKEKRLKRLHERAEVADWWRSGFASLRSQAVGQALTFLTQRAKRYARVLMDGEFRPVLKAWSETQSGKTTDKISLEVRGGSYEAASSGERDRIDLVLALALHDLAAQSSGFACNILVLDEPAVFVDKTGVRRLMDLLRSGSVKAESIFLITQNVAFKGYADTTWTVVKEGGQSRLEIAT